MMPSSAATERRQDASETVVRLFPRRLPPAVLLASLQAARVAAWRLERSPSLAGHARSTKGGTAKLHEDKGEEEQEDETGGVRRRRRRRRKCRRHGHGGGICRRRLQPPRTHDPGPEPGVQGSASRLENTFEPPFPPAHVAAADRRGRGPGRAAKQRARQGQRGGRPRANSRPASGEAGAAAADHRSESRFLAARIIMGAGGGGKAS
ncbi:unnamed protein product [Prorocentrum cordatum]|uniref:Uncharacterized protein n=1 Tax=Prorocentrum cordatum TaxID=2364126 RepID=A0ABN9SCW5_9DINO|nr:unnamed protein product [Polarella glacialis]CAK0829827.1 unnamed protein product [Polarella glacialis]